MQSLADTRESFRTAATAALLGVAVVLGLLETVLVPPVAVPGVRLGLANLAVVVAMSMFGPRQAAFVSLGRVLLVALASGTLGGPGFLMSLSGAMASLIVMWALSTRGTVFSEVGWSIGGAAAHVAAQLLVASLIIGSSAPLAFAPFSLGLSLPTGLTVGYCARLLLSRIPELSLSAAGR